MANRQQPAAKKDRMSLEEHLEHLRGMGFKINDPTKAKGFAIIGAGGARPPDPPQANPPADPPKPHTAN